MRAEVEIGDEPILRLQTDGALDDLAVLEQRDHRDREDAVLAG